MFMDSPPAIVYEIPTETPAATTAAEVDRQPMKDAISVQAFGMADNNLGVYQENSRVHFYDWFTATKNAKIVESSSTFMQYSSYNLYHSGSSSVTVEFELKEEDLKEDLGLYLTHLSSDLHRGTYDSAIRIFVNGSILRECYVPASHDWIKNDRFDLSALVQNGTLHAGSNRVQIQLHESALSCYWLHCIVIK